MLTVGN